MFTQPLHTVSSKLVNVAGMGFQIFVKSIHWDDFVKSIHWDDQKAFALEVVGTDTIEAVKDKIQEETGFPPDDQRVIFDGKEIEDGRTLQDYNIQKETTIYVMIIKVLRKGMPNCNLTLIVT